MAQIDFERLLKQAMGLDAISIGSATIDRAVRERMKTLGLERREEFWQRLHDSAHEIQELVETVVVPETSFFRDREAFSALVRLVYGEWLPAHATGTLRLLSAPCSTGEEPYSIVMALSDAGFPMERLRVDALDISRRALTHAKRGVYGSNSFRGENLSFRERHFRATEDGYVLVNRFTETVKFRYANILSDDFHSGEEMYDVIFCRNLLIYFDQPTQKRVMSTLERLLTPGGFLFVGPAEAFVASCSGFTSVNQAMSFAFRKSPAKRTDAARDLPGKPRTPAKAVDSPRLKPKPRSPVSIPVASVPALSVPSPDLEMVRRLADAGRIQEAVKGCERHLDLQGPSAEAYYLLALLQDTAGNAKGALEHYRKALYLDPGHSEALLHLALLTEALGDTAAAERFRERARRLERNPRQVTS